MKKLRAYYFVCSVVFLLAGCSNGNGQLSKAEHELAVKNYQQYCAGCHGFKLEKFEKKDWMYGDNMESVINSITNGREEMGMPAFEVTFSEEEISALASYVINGLPENKDELKPALSGNDKVESEVQAFIVDTVVSGLDVPWGLEFLPNGDLLISERAAKLYRFTTNGELQEITGLPEIMVKGQGGLLDLELHPDYENNGWLYFTYSGYAEDNKNEGCTNVMRARLNGNTLVDQEVIFNGTPDSDRGQHWGSKLEFDKNGYLFFGVGDRGNRDENPQSLANHAGKIHRIMEDGSIPPDNPFIDTPGAILSIYSYGHRNPQGTCMNPETGEIFETEHGPMGGDELNLIKPGLNYGWPVISYGINYNGTKFTDITEKEGMEQPLTYWVPSIAPCGMTFVKGDLYPAWKNNILIGSLRFQYLERVVLDGYEVTHHEKLLEGIGRVRNVEMSPDGYVYVAIENPGKILRLVPVN
ncbi:PQQ-dependent sugar dehydrogenase [Mangrovibacterium diazotrophicum]|uniref:Glucose/arabinose dehydrogenase n=1 Tax=Mangrovibacterium diazotrophicum TaxID=1261403 RepID=A0A419VWL3_9BACT|nr:PQQ-dependent sugar dehydrogenase [Mangrovibacterium diazotrophicum]RKD86545.1 glucose/arabinose dehydrogenase [Mangrovibacterium diazotrophicum]